MKPKLIIVEGRHDAQKIRSIFPDFPTMITQGSAIDDAIIKHIQTYEDTHEIILFLDPDHAGERIRRILSQSLKNVTHAFLTPEVATSKNGRKIGIEHASAEDIRQAFDHIHMEHEKTKSDVDFSFLYAYGLIGQPDSKSLREKVVRKLNIGHANGKTLLYRLHRFNITKNQIIEVLK